MPKCTVERTGFLLYCVFFLSRKIGRKVSKANKISKKLKVEITSSSRLNIFAIRVFFLFKSFQLWQGCWSPSNSSRTFNMLRQFYLCVIALNLWLVQWLTTGNASFGSVPSKKHILTSHCQLSQLASALAFDLSKPTQLLLFHGKLCFHTKKGSLLKWTGYCFCPCSVSGSDTIKCFLFHYFYVYSGQLFAFQG